MKRSVSFASGLAGVASYLLFALLAFLKFQGSFSPTKNWLSDLGSKELNPQGAVFYNAGIVLTGVCLIVFFAGLGFWKIAENKAQKILLPLTQIFGVMGSAAMVMSAVFPITSTATHSFWSTGLYILLGTAFALSVAALRYHAQVPRWVLIIGAIVVVVNFVWCVALNIQPLEWATVGLFLLYVVLLSLGAKQWGLRSTGASGASTV